MKVTAFITSLAIVGSEAFAPGVENTRSSTGEYKIYVLQLELNSYTFREDTQQLRKIYTVGDVREDFILGTSPTTELILYYNYPSKIEENEKHSNIRQISCLCDMLFIHTQYIYISYAHISKQPLAQRREPHHVWNSSNNLLLLPQL